MFLSIMKFRVYGFLLIGNVIQLFINYKKNNAIKNLTNENQILYPVK